MKKKSLSFVSSLNPLQKRTMHGMKCGACQRMFGSTRKRISRNLNQNRHNERKTEKRILSPQMKMFISREIANKKAEIGINLLHL